MPATLPANRIALPEPPYTVGTIPPGVTFGMPHWAMLVDEDGSCYLDPTETLESDPTLASVRRDESGYHVTIHLPVVTWEPISIDPKEKERLIPRATLKDEA